MSRSSDAYLIATSVALSLCAAGGAIIMLATGFTTNHPKASLCIDGFLMAVISLALWLGLQAGPRRPK